MQVRQLSPRPVALKNNKPMHFWRLKKTRGSLELASAPTRARPAEESQSLADKYDAQVKWMRERGIAGGLDGTPERGRKVACSAPVGLVGPKNSEE